MITDENKTEIIERYLQNDLTAAELVSFNEKMAADAAFRREVALQKRVVESVQAAEFKDLLNQFHPPAGAISPGVPAQDQAEARVVFLGRPRWFAYAAAASASLLLTVGLVLYLNRSPVAPQIARIKYVVTADGQNLGMAGVGTDSTIAVKIHPPTKEYPFHYRFDDTLRLYGDFDPAGLTLQYDPTREVYQVQDRNVTYPVERYRAIAPLVKLPD